MPVTTKSKTTEAERAEKRAHKELARARAELDKVNKRIERAKQKERREQQATYAREAKRRFLPDEYPLPGSEQVVPSVLLPLDFDSLDGDDEIRKAVVQCLKSNHYSGIFRALADLFVVYREDVCLVEHRIITRAGKRCEVVYFRYSFCPAFNEFLKQHCAAKYDSRLKSWNVLVTDELASELNIAIGRYFRVVIDLQSLSIFSNRNDASFSKPRQACFVLLNEPRSFSYSDVCALLESIAPGQQRVMKDTFCVHTGESFSALSSSAVVKSSVDKLLVRYYGRPGQTQYALLPLTSPGEVRLAFGRDKTEAAALIASYVDSFRFAAPGARVEVLHEDQS